MVTTMNDKPITATEIRNRVKAVFESMSTDSEFHARLTSLKELENLLLEGRVTHALIVIRAEIAHLESKLLVIGVDLAAEDVE